MALIYDEPDKVAYCSVPKVASSTWCWHFIQLANMSQEEAAKRKQVLQTFAPNLWPAPAIEDGLREAWARTTSLVIVRHPLSRWAEQSLVITGLTPCAQAGVRLLSEVYQAGQARDLGSQDQDDHWELPGQAQHRGPGPPHARGVHQIHPGQAQGKQAADRSPLEATTSPGE